MTDSIRQIITPSEKDLGDFSVRRVLPAAKQRAVGPWVFFDHFGPVHFPPGGGISVRPHPHINLATVTYLFEGEIFHRDSLGNALAIHPGAINLMVAGKGIVHSERTRGDLRQLGSDLHGLQLWLALPEEVEETEPAFYNHSAEMIPSLQITGVHVRVMMGTAFGITSPVETFSPTLYLEADLADGASLDVPENVEEAGIYVVKGAALVDGMCVPLNAMAVLNINKARTITAIGETRFAMIGGTSLGRRHLWWNFVSSRKERIEQAKKHWQEGRFASVPGDEQEFIPLPE